MSAHLHLIPTLVRVKEHFRRTPSGKITFVSSYEALRMVREQEQEEEQSPQSDEKVVADMRETFEKFTALVKYCREHGGALYPHGPSLRGYLRQCFPGEDSEVLSYMEQYEIIPLTLFYLAPLLPENERNIVERAMQAFGAYAANKAMVAAGKIAATHVDIDLIDTETMDELERLEQLLGTLPPSLPQLCDLSYPPTPYIATRVLNLWRKFREADNPEVRQHAERVGALVPLLLFTSAMQTASSKPQLYSCGEELGALCEGISCITKALIHWQYDDTNSPFTPLDERDAVGLTYAIAAEVADTFASFTRSTAARLDATALRERIHIPIIADTIERFAQRLRDAAQETSEDVRRKSFLLREVPRWLVQCLMESTRAHLGEPQPDTRGFKFLDAVASRIISPEKVQAAIHALALAHPVIERAHRYAYELSQDISLSAEDYGDRCLEERNKDLNSLQRFLEAGLAYRIGEADMPACREYFQPFVDELARYYAEALEEFEHIYSTDVTSSNVRQAHPLLRQLFGGADSAECDIELPPEYGARIATLARGLATSLQWLRDNLTPMTKLPEEVATHLRGERWRLEEKLFNAMMSIAAGKVAQRAKSIGVQELVESAMAQVFAPKVPEELQQYLEVMQQHRSVIQAVAAVEKLRRKGITDEERLRRTVGDAVWQEYQKRHLLPLQSKTSEALWEYAIQCFRAEKQYRDLRTATVAKLAEAIRTVEGEEKVDYARFIARHAHSALGGRSEAGGLKPAEEERKIREAYENLRAGVQLQWRPMKVRVACDRDAFAKIGHYGVDNQSCIRDGGICEGSKWRFAVYNKRGVETFVATMHTPDGEACVARLLGVLRRVSDTEYELFLTNVDDSGNRLFREGLIDGVAKLFEQRLGVTAGKPQRRRRLPQLMGILYQDGDGVSIPLRRQRLTFV